MAIICYPLKQAVKAPTRKVTILDKIYTNIHDWYSVPAVLPNIGRSDHHAVVLSTKSMSVAKLSEWSDAARTPTASAAGPGLAEHQLDVAVQHVTL